MLRSAGERQTASWRRPAAGTTGEWLAARLEVSLRTGYLDIADLQAQGVATPPGPRGAALC